MSSLRSASASTSDSIKLPSEDDFFAVLRSQKAKLKEIEQEDSDGKDNASPLKTRHDNDKSAIAPNSKECAYREKKFPVVNKVLRQEIKCTACGTNVKQLVQLCGPVYSHPLLATLMCKNCLSYYGDGEFSVDEDGTDNYCRWCGQGGDMFCCTDCSCVFCKECTKRNLGRSFVKEVDESEDWKCFVCDIKPLWDLRAINWAVEEYIDDTVKEKKEHAKQKLNVLASKRKDSPEKPKSRRELVRKRTSGTDSGSANNEVKERKTKRIEKKENGTSDSDGSDHSRSTSLIGKVKVSSKPNKFLKINKDTKRKESESEDSSDSDFEQTSRNKSKNLKTRNKSREVKKKTSNSSDSDMISISSDSEVERNSRNKRKDKHSPRVSKPVAGKNDVRRKKDDSDSSDSDSEKPEQRRRPVPKSKRRPSRGAPLKDDRAADTTTDSSDSDHPKKGGKFNSRLASKGEKKNLKTVGSVSSDSSDSARKDKKQSPSKSPVIRSKAEKEKLLLKKVSKAVISSGEKKSRSRTVDESNSESSETDQPSPRSKNKRSSNIGNSESSRRNVLSSSFKRKLDFSSKSKNVDALKKNKVNKQNGNDEDSFDLPNGLNSEMHRKHKSEVDLVDTNLPNGTLNSDSETSPVVIPPQESLGTDEDLPTTIDEESEQKAQALLQEQCLDLRILSKSLSRAVKQIQGRISTEDPVKIQKSIQKIQSLIVKTKENMDHQSSCLKSKGERWTRKVIAKARIRTKRNLTKGKDVASRGLGSNKTEDSSEVGPSRKVKTSTNVNTEVADDVSNTVHVDTDGVDKIVDKENKSVKSDEEVVSPTKDNDQANNMSTESEMPGGSREENVDENITVNNQTEDSAPGENKIENGDKELNTSVLSSQETQEYRLLLNDLTLDTSINSEVGTEEKSPQKEGKSRRSSVDIFSDEEEEPLNLDDTVKSLDDLDVESGTDITIAKEKGELTEKSQKDKELLLASSSSDEELPIGSKLNGKNKKSTEEALPVSSLVDEETMAESNCKLEKNKLSSQTLTDKEALLATSSDDDAPLVGPKDTKLVEKVLKFKVASAASSSEDSGPNEKSEQKDKKKKLTKVALKDKEALLASSSSDEEPLTKSKGKEERKAETEKDDKAGSDTEATPKATRSKAKIGPKSRVHKSSEEEDNSSVSDFDLSVKKRKRKTDGNRKRKKRCVDVDLESFGDKKLTFDLTVNVVKLTEQDLQEHNIDEIPSCSEGAKERRKGGRRDSSDDVQKLLDLKSLHRGTKSKRSRRSSTHSNTPESDASTPSKTTAMAKAKKASHSRKKKKEEDEQRLVDYLHKKSDDSETSEIENEDDNDSEKAVKKSANLKKKVEMQKKLASKQMLLDALMSTSDESDAVQSDGKDDKKKKGKEKKKKKTVEDEDEDGKEEETEVVGEPEEGDVDDGEKKSDQESDGDSSETARKKKKKKKWRNNKLLRGKLSETDTSDEDRKWAAKKKGEKEKKGRKKPSRKAVGTDSDSDLVKISSVSSSSDDGIFVPSKKKKKAEQAKKGKRDSSDSESDKPKKKVKRRRIRTPTDSSASDADDVDESQRSTPGKGRKNIRRVLKADSVGEMTRKAAKEEEDRRLRILEKQKLYNQLYDNLQDGVVKTDKLVLDFDPETKKELVSVDTEIVQKLKPHQVQGVKFMWDACFESVKRLQKSPGSGCILAHCMGLGKTFQVVTLVHTLLTNKRTKVKTVLVICPLSTVLNWVNEFMMWLKDIQEDEEIEIYELSKYKQAFERSYQLKEWHSRGGVMVLSYDMFRNLSNPVQKRVRKSILDTYKRTLMDPGPDLVICDEGHLLKNEKTAISKAVGKVNTLRRIALTGTPLQNNLGEYHCMVQFVKPNLLGTKKEFSNRFINPITNGQFENSTVHDVKIMKRRAHVLHKMLEGCVQRFDYSVLTPFLPPKQEYVISVRLSDTQIKIYQHYLDNFARGIGRAQNTKLFADFQYMQRIWTHPKVLMWNVEKTERLNLNKEGTDSEGSLRDFVVNDTGDESDEASSKSDVVKISEDESKSAAEKSGSETEEVVKKWSSSARSKRLAARTEKEASDVEVMEVEPAQNNPLEWWKDYTKEEDFDDLRLSGKLVLFFSILRECEKIGDKVLVFSQSMFSLDLIEHFLSLIDAETQRTKNDKDADEGMSEKLDHHRGSWARGLDYFRLDGSVSGENRSIACKMFNKEDNLRGRLYLISTKAGGLGINLFAANRVIIFDASWNPSHDVQSIFRVYRFGQKKPCYIYRLLAYGTMEEKIYERQVTKLSLACRVVDEQQIERHYTSHDLQEMYTFSNAPVERPTPILPKDRLLAELLKEHEKWIETYHEHDSLLENKSEEELNEEERKAAWEDYENEKKAPAQGLLNPNQGMNNYLTYIKSLSPEAIREVLRKENPTATEEQITDRVRMLMAAVYKQYEQQQTFNKQVQAYHLLQNQQMANQAAYGGSAHPTALYLNNAAAMPNNLMFNQGMLGSAGASHLPNLLQSQTYSYQNLLNQMGTKVIPPVVHTGGAGTSKAQTAGTTKAAPGGFLKVRNFAEMQEPPRPTFSTVPTMRPLNMKGSSRGVPTALVKNPLFSAKKAPTAVGKGAASSTSGPPKSPEIETIDSD